MNNWKSPKDELPEDRGEPYQVIAAQKKKLGGAYEGTHRRIFTQDWHIRCWPENFVAWQYDCVGVVFTKEKLPAIDADYDSRINY